MSKGFSKLRHGLIEHVEKGKLSPSTLGVYTMLHLVADYKTGIWIGSAVKLQMLYFSTVDMRTLQRIIEHLEQIHFIRCFRVRGKKGNYPILIHKYVVADAPMIGKRLDAWKTTDWQHPHYDRIGPAGRPAADRDGDAPTLKEVKKKKEKKKRKGPFVFEGEHLAITVVDDRVLADAFPQPSGKERLGLYREMDAWLRANPTRKPKNEYRFAYEWVKRQYRNNPGKSAEVPVAKPYY